MSPVATNQPIYTPSNGTQSPLDGPAHPAPVHPTAERRPYNIVVNSDKTSYSEEFITSKYDNRGADVVTSSDGKINIVPTLQSYEFRTALKVPKTGYVVLFFVLFPQFY